MTLSIVIPVLNEEEVIGPSLSSLVNGDQEIIVVDGGSLDKTREVAHRYTPHVMSSPRGRGMQQDVGARHARGDTLLFLHADTLLPLGFREMVLGALLDPRVTFGAFRLEIVPPSPSMNLIALMANFRTRLLKMPYGDQALFMRRQTYLLTGGFRDLALMEDVDLVRRLNRQGSFKLVQGFVKTSARRWKREGVLYTTLRNWSLMVRFLLGQSPRRLQRLYRDVR